MIRRALAAVALAFVAASWASSALAQAPASPDFVITDNSFLVEEAFNQERGVVQNIFTWTRIHKDEWAATFTQEWPAPGVRHQLSYTVPFSHAGSMTGFNDMLVNYRYQLLEEGDGRPAIAPRASLILPTGKSSEGFGDGRAGLQVNVPVSKRFGDVYLHGNIGTTWLPGVSRVDAIGGSAIWRATPMFHLLLESVAELGESVAVSPGFRRGWNAGDSQIVVGLAVPITRADGTSHAAVLTYFSYELPFRSSQ